MRIYIRALSYYRADWAALAVQFTLVSLVTGVNLLAAWPLVLLVDTVLNPAVQWSPSTARLFSFLPASPAMQIVTLALSVVVLRMLSDGLTAAQAAVSNHVNWRGTRRVRADLYRALRRLGPAYYANNARPAGDGLYRFTIDAFGPQQILGTMIGAAVSAVTVCSVVYVLLGRHVGLTIASLAVMPLMSLINRTWGPRLAERMVAIRAQEAELVAHVQNVSTPRQGRRSANSSYPRSTRTTLTTWWRHARALLAYNWLIGATQGLGAAVVFGYGGWLVHNGKSGLTIGELTLFLSYVGQLWGPLATITGLSAGLSNGASGARRIFEVLDAAATVTGGPRSIAMPGGPVLAGDRQAA